MPIEIRDPKTFTLPDELRAAATAGALSFFVGNGVSQLCGLPSWNQLADRMLECLQTHKKIDHLTLELLKRRSTKLKISIADNLFKENWKSTERIQELTYKSVLMNKLSETEIEKNPVYASIAKCGVKFITTNYDNILANALEGNLEAEPIENTEIGNTDSEAATVVKKAARQVHILDGLSDVDTTSVLNENIIFHIHGSIADESKIVASTQDYMNLYGNKENQKLLLRLMKRQTVVFIGYGLDELELLDIIVRAARSDDREHLHSKFHLLLPLYKYEKSIANHLESYYKSLGISLHLFCMDTNGYHNLGDVLELWATELVTLKRGPTNTEINYVMDDLMAQLIEAENV